VFYAEKYTEWLRTAPGLLQTLAAPDLKDGPLLGPCECYVLVEAQRPKKTVLSSPQADVDNFAKAVLDAVTHAGIWRDDRQVEMLMIRKAWAAEGRAGRVRISISETGEPLPQPVKRKPSGAPKAPAKPRARRKARTSKKRCSKGAESAA
jgi:Holliday junction resolvase RusA-like endonuclease